MKFVVIKCRLGHDTYFFFRRNIEFFSILSIFDHCIWSLTPSADPLYFRMARITDDHNMGTSGAFSLNDLVDLQHKRTGNIYISETIFFDRVINPAAYSMGTDHKPAEIAQNAIAYAEKNGHNVVILDTAGRLHVDEDMMAELQEIKETVTVHQTLLVVDAMTGQDAVNVAKTFTDKVGIDGVILTKMDGDTRGGAALSIKAVTGKPILYVGMGEKLSDLEQFYPERMASRILGMGDVMSLIEKAEAAIDQEQAAEMQKKLKKMDFDFNDYLTSMEQMKKMGGIGSILNMLPGVGSKMKDIEGMVDESALERTKSIILSMTPQERTNPGILNVSRKNRIARGAGVDIAEVNRLVKQFEQSKKMMKQMPGMMGGKMGKRGGFKLPF